MRLAFPSYTNGRPSEGSRNRTFFDDDVEWSALYPPVFLVSSHQPADSDSCALAAGDERGNTHACACGPRLRGSHEYSLIDASGRTDVARSIAYYSVNIRQEEYDDDNE